MKPIPYGKQYISDEDIAEVNKVLKSDFLTQGPTVMEFEESFADFIGVKYASAVANGTAALHLSAIALNVKPGDKVITSPITFAASANCIKYCGGEIDFVDIDPITYLIDLDKLEEKLKNQPKGTYKGVIPVNFAGFPVNLERLKSIAEKHNLWIIEDASHSPGGYFTDSGNIKQYCGNGVFTELAIFSFHPVKHIAAGEGGMITTNDKNLYTKINYLRTHGITKNPDLISQNHGGWYYEMIDLGYNYRISDVHSALGLSQLARLQDNLNRRHELVNRYNKAFEKTSLVRPYCSDSVYHAYHLYVIQTDRRKEMYNYLKEKKILCQVHYIPVHLLPYYQKLGWNKGDFPIAEEYYNRALSIPLYPTLTDEQQEYVIKTILNFL